MAEKPSESSEKLVSDREKNEPAKPIAPVPRQAAASGDRAAVPAAGGTVAPTALNQQLMDALAQVLTNQSAVPAPPPRDDRGLMSREEKRFRRAGAVPRADAPAEKLDDPIGEPPNASENTPIELAVVETSASGPVESPERRMRVDRHEPVTMRPKAPSIRTVWRNLPGWQQGAILAVLGALLAFAGFVVGRAGESAPTPGGSRLDAGPARPNVEGATARVVPRMAEANEIKLIDEAMIAQTNGDFPKAGKLLRQLWQQAPDVTGTQTALALLSIQRGDFVTAEYHIGAGIDAGEDAGRLYGLRGMLLTRLNRPRRANEAFELSTRAAPHQFRNFFLWAEFLRRVGNNQQALTRLDQAIARVHEQSDEEAMQFKRRLTLIALGRGNELAAEIQHQLALNPPSGDWLLVALAFEAQKGDFTAAAVHLERASRLMSTEALIERLRDFYFYQWCYEKELEPYFHPLQKRLTVYRQAEPPVEASKENEDRPLPGAPPAPVNP